MMKKIESGFVIVFLVGVVFFLLKLPFASELLILSIGSLACLYMYFSVVIFNDLPIKNIFKKGEEGQGKFQKLIGGGFLGMLLAINLLGALFKVMSWPFSNEMLLISLPIIGILLLISIYLNSKTPSKFYKNIILRYALWGLFSLLLMMLPKNFIRDFRFANYPEYIEALDAYDKNPTDENYNLLEKEREKIYNVNE